MILSLIVPVLMLALAHRWSADVREQSRRPPPACAPSHVTKVKR